MNCKSCKYFRENKGIFQSGGICFRYPPQLVAAEWKSADGLVANQVFRVSAVTENRPHVKADDWCGEHFEKESG